MAARRRVKLGLSAEELQRLQDVLNAYLRLPTSTDVHPDALEEMFAWAVGGTTPMTRAGKAGRRRRRSKLLFDVTRADVGWSLKTFAPNSLDPGSEFEVVVARASVEAKARRGRSKVRVQELEGNPVERTINVATSSDEDVGQAVMQIRRDVFALSAERQEVGDAREAFLLRDSANAECVYFEQPLEIEPNDAIRWRWTNDERRGLQGEVAGEGEVGGRTKYRWYQSGAQLFAKYSIPKDAQRFRLEWEQVSFEEFVGRLT